MFALTVALFVLAGISGIYKGELDSGSWILFIGKCVGYCAFVFIVFPRFARWFFRTYEDNVMQYIFVLALVFLSAALAELAGMEGIFGAFLAGLVLNRLIPHVSPLMNRTEFVGNALFIPYFLIGVGMLINLGALFNGGDTIKVVIVMVVVATLTKCLPPHRRGLYDTRYRESGQLDLRRLLFLLRHGTNSFGHPRSTR